MNKPTELREHLLARVQWLKENPDKLFMFIEGGRIGARRSKSLSFTYSYSLKLLLLDCPIQTDLITVPLLSWIAVNQSDRMHHPDRTGQVFDFVAEVLNKKTTDIEITLQLTESVLVEYVRGEGGGAGHYEIRHIDEPPLPDLGGPSAWEMYADEDPVLQPPLPDPEP